jgi:hypothetical protein
MYVSDDNQSVDNWVVSVSEVMTRRVAHVVPGRL